jgi:transposase
MPRYSEEFKQEAIRPVRGEGISLLQVGRIVGANHNMILEWVKKAESEDQSAKEYASEREELLALRRELKETRMERDFLKKTLVYFAKDQK